MERQPEHALLAASRRGQALDVEEYGGRRPARLKNLDDAALLDDEQAVASIRSGRDKDRPRQARDHALERDGGRGGERESGGERQCHERGAAGGGSRSHEALTLAQPGAIEVRTEEVFGNCPKYIQARAPEDDTRRPPVEAAQRSRALTAKPRRVLERADTFFIASVHDGTGADASHRGDQPGFVQVVDDRTLRIPDYSGNNMFQTLGNIAADPRVGLLFVDFDTGTTIQLTAHARILWEREAFADLKGAERALEVDEVVEIAGRGPLGWRFLDYSPFNPR